MEQGRTRAVMGPLTRSLMPVSLSHPDSDCLSKRKVTYVLLPGHCVSKPNAWLIFSLQSSLAIETMCPGCDLVPPKAWVSRDPECRSNLFSIPSSFPDSRSLKGILGPLQPRENELRRKSSVWRASLFVKGP